MSMVSHLHQLFNPETCQSSIHRLRWKERPLQGPPCQGSALHVCAVKTVRWNG